MDPFFQSNYLETSPVNADLENTKVMTDRMELVVEDVEIANREPVKVTGARTTRKLREKPLPRLRVKPKPLSKRPKSPSLLRKNLKKKLACPTLTT